MNEKMRGKKEAAEKKWKKSTQKKKENGKSYFANIKKKIVGKVQ